MIEQADAAIADEFTFEELTARITTEPMLGGHCGGCTGCSGCANLD